jgi:nicotinic acid mononucleotide adenylyltransferase
MTTPNANDVNEIKDGETIALFLSKFDPATMDHWRAIEALLKRQDTKNIWLVPIGSEHGRHMATIMAADFGANGNKITTCQTMKTNDKEAADWISSHFKKYKFRAVVLASENDEFTEVNEPIVIRFKSQHAKTETIDVIGLDNFLPSPMDVIERIKCGHDESRNFIPAVWNYIQRKKLYRMN